MSIWKLAGACALAIAVPAAAQDEPPIPAKGAWVFDFLTDASYGMGNNTPRACIGSDAVIDLDAQLVREVDVGPGVRIIYAPVGPRAGSPEPEWQVLRLSRPSNPTTEYVVKVVQVPVENRGVALLYMEQLRNPALRDAALLRIEQRIAEAGPDREKLYRRCEK